MVGLRWMLLGAALAMPGPAFAQMRGSGAPDVPSVPALMARAKPLADPAYWIGEDDYPRAALRAEQEGRVGVLLSIDPAGRVTDCSILASSGVALLDRHSCDLLKRRIRFTPAMTRGRKPAPDRWNYSIEWKLPDIKWVPQPEQRTNEPWNMFTESLYPREARPRDDAESWVRPKDYPRRLRERFVGADVALTIGSGGHVMDCQVTDTSGSPEWDRTLCSILRRRARFDPARNDAGKRVRGRWEYRYVWRPAARQ
jgi:TonB family protein